MMNDKTALRDRQSAYQILDWDTAFFGFKVARVMRPSLAKKELAAILSELKDAGVTLVYWPASYRLKVGETKELGGLLVDDKTTFVIDFPKSEAGLDVPIKAVETYSRSMPAGDLEDLAIQSGEYSRFAVDPHLPREKFEALYRIWIRRSLAKQIAREVLVIRNGRAVIGMVTLGEKKGRGEIGLIAVDTKFRRRQFGSKLVVASRKWFIENAFRMGQVVTQGRNLPACKFYKKWGFKIEKVEYYYHFWLENST